MQQQSALQSNMVCRRMLALTRDASCWTAVVLPVPVSPTSSTGSCCCTATATDSSRRMACPVCAKLVPSGPCRQPGH